MSEADVLAALERRYRSESGNGPVWAFVPKVRNAAGFAATRTIDALAMSLWPSRGLELHGHEIKCSRSDWLRELRDAAKAETFADLVDRWWLVVSDRKIVKEGELPETWGLMCVQRRGVVVVKQAPLLPDTGSEWMPRTFLAALLRSACRTQQTTPEEVEAAVAAERARWDAEHTKTIERWREDRDELRTIIDAFERESGLSLRYRNYGLGDRVTVSEIGRQVRLALAGGLDVGRIEERLGHLANQAQSIAEAARAAAGGSA